MKRIYFTPAFLLTVFLFASCTTVYKYNQDFSEPDKLEKGEGIVVFCIRNSLAGAQCQYPINNHSSEIGVEYILPKIQIAPSVGIKTFSITNDTAPYQLVCIKLPKGTWHLSEIGENSQFTYSEHYSFSVVPGVVNYVGDWELSVYPFVGLGGLTDVYTVSVSDRKDETLQLLYSSHPELSNREVVNATVVTEQLYPRFWKSKIEQYEEALKNGDVVVRYD